MIGFLTGLPKSEIEFWLEVSEGALQRTQKEIKVLTHKNYRKRVKKVLSESERKKMLVQKRADERDLLERMEQWERVLNKKRGG